ncbi:hypothetical protein B7Z17_01385 [Candidatus Saccharibacteria bacterium 32-49-10]|nr:MAG: hypothetical protein B7Z17_01385 [Candidatus Saccharibacteria bacterium 32-49-10]
MAKTKKKRNKKYTGADAASARPTITRVQAVNRSRTGQWLYEKRKLARPVGIVALIVAVLVLVISGIISLF